MHRHEATAETGSVPIPCEICSEVVPSSKFIQHMRKHKIEGLRPGKKSLIDSKKHSMPIEQQLISDPKLLPRIKYEDKGDIKECEICMEKYKLNDVLIYLTCFHNFHEKCLMSWLRVKPICPICKNQILKK